MLTHLHIQNVALIDDTSLAFHKGLSVLSGETGAGKSVLITALALVLGDRADREQIRHGFEKAIVSATFDVSAFPASFKKSLRDFIEADAISIQREISRDGNSRIRVRNTLCSLTKLKEITATLAEIVGQHANQLLMDEENHLFFLDQFANLIELRDLVGEVFVRWEDVASEVRRLRNKRDQLISERELLLFQQDELQKAGLRVGEEEELIRERKILDSARALMTSADLIGNILDGEEQSVISDLRLARKELEKMAAVDATLAAKVTEVNDLDFRIEDFRRFIEQYGASVPDDQARLEEINSRLDEIYAIKKKYGGSETSAIQTLADISLKLQSRPDIDAQIDQLQRQNDQLRAEYTDKAVDLSATRKKAAVYLQKLVVKELADLAIDRAKFECEFVYEDAADGIEIDGRKVKPTVNGLESGRFLFSANPGEPLKPLVKTASGGEISRVLLALKAAEKKSSHRSLSLLAFDEVDTGIGGRTANEVARKLKKMAEGNQVLVVTHLHQIARLADHHYVAEKEAGDARRLVISVRKLEASEVAGELDRMVALPEA